ncbi:MAG: DNA-formamidopyrimidine glycosylase family protein [Jiangellales bacterium]
MPEGDTVWLTARRLHDALAGHTVVRGELRVPQHATAEISGRAVREVVSRGKHLLLRFDDGTTLHTHLRMDGAWHLYGARERWRGGPAWQVRALLVTSTRAAVGYRLPVVALIATADEADVVGHLGPDLLGEDWDEAEALHRLTGDPQRPIGEALLDQTVMAGLGNLYRTELCFVLGVTPWTPVGDVGSLARAPGLAHRMLVANRDGPAQPTTGRTRRGEEHWVYRRRACLRCATPVRRSMQGRAGQERVTYWCPACQHGPTG